MIRVLIVEDSPVVQALLDHILSSDPEIHVIGTASNGAEALGLLKRMKPDIITMDIHMPEMNGYEAIRRIMETHPVPIVIVSAGYNQEDLEQTFRALEAGAVAVVEKPAGVEHPGFENVAKKLIETVKLMSEVKVVRRWSRLRRADTGASRPGLTLKQRPGDIKCVAIGASTGGPPVLQTVLSRLSKDFSAPIFIVQHIAAGFLQGLVDWLRQATGLPVHIASQGESPLPGHVYFAPDGFQMGVDSGGRIALRKEQQGNGLCPSASYLFRSVAEVFGPYAVGVLLTGMGNDGAEGLKLMKEKGAVTIAQDKDSSVVHGMPGEAIKLGAATYVLTPERIAITLERLASKK
ncbi:MAG: chemotaxis-specific protein-glutamate methyltransferase CheB [Firmicutes bacterium]|nr:chemotaxis-specific protein-glutamate methyltransferase CheB [Bacillota bacterium]